MSCPVVNLGEICETTQGVQITKANTQSQPYDGGYRYLYIADFIKDNKLSFIDDVFDHKKVSVNDLVMANTGSPGRVFKGKDGILSNNLFKISFDQNLIDRDYLYLVLSSKIFQNILQQQMKGGIQKHLGHKTIARQHIPLPPLKEQKRIAAILDKADNLRRKRQQAIQLADEFLRAVFLDMFGDPVANPKGWLKVILGDLLHFAKDGPHVSPEYSDIGVPFLSTRHIRPSGVIWEDLKYITLAEAEIHWKKCEPKYGDILYTKGGTTGIACQVDFNKKFAVWVHVALLRPQQEKVNFVWLTHMLNSKYCYLQSQKYTRGATNKDLGLKRMVDIKMYIPPLEEQIKFVIIKDKLMGLISSSNDFKDEKLFESLSQKAFSGEL